MEYKGIRLDWGYRKDIRVEETLVLALKRVDEVKKIAKRKSFKNIVTIASDCQTGLPENSVDTVLLYDVFHSLGRPNDVLQEIQRILKPGGTLSFSDHHMNAKEVLEMVTGAGMFRFVRKGKKTYRFAKNG